MVDCQKNKANKVIAEQHIVLITDKRLHRFPWESLTPLRGKSVSRVPALSFIRDRLRSDVAKTDKYSVRDACYVLNPSGDLVETEKRMKPHLERYTCYK